MLFGVLLRVYGHGHVERCRAFVSVPGPMQTCQRAEFWSVTVALQSCWPCRLGIDNLNVARSVGRLLDHGCLAKPLSSVKDGDLVAVIQHMIRARGQDTVRVTKVKGHATEADVQQGKVREEDRFGNEEADAAADLGGRQQVSWKGLWMSGVLCSMQGIPGIPLFLQLHRFMVAVSRVVVNHDWRGGSAPDPLVWDRGGKKKQRKVDVRVNIDLATLLGPPWLLEWAWVQVDGGVIAGADVAVWPCSVSMLCKETDGSSNGQKEYNLAVLVHGSMWPGSKGGTFRLWPPSTGQKESIRENGITTKEKRG